MQKYVTISISPKSKIIIDRLADKYEMNQKDTACPLFIDSAYHAIIHRSMGIVPCYAGTSSGKSKRDSG